MKVLFLCRGNVGRSTFAKYIFDKLASTHKSDSAGTKPSGEGETLEEINADYVIQAMDEEGVDVSKHTRKAVTPSMINESDIVVSMAEHDTVPDYVLNHPRFIEWIIDDPKGTSLEDHIKIKNKVKEKVVALINSL